jgi:hypothetical protein
MRVMAWTAVGLALTACMACVGLHGPEDLRRDLVQATGVELDRETGISVGPVGVMVARWFTSEDEVPLKGVRRVQVGIYTVTDRGNDDYGDGLVDLPDLPGWESVVRVHEDDESVFVMLHQDKKTIRGMLVLVMERDEWVLVRIKGKLQHVVEQAMHMAFEEAERPELYETAVAEYRESHPSGAEESADAL